MSLSLHGLVIPVFRRQTSRMQSDLSDWSNNAQLSSQSSFLPCLSTELSGLFHAFISTTSAFCSVSFAWA